MARRDIHELPLLKPDAPEEMMGIFITVKINSDLCGRDCASCVDTCPVNVFVLKDNKAVVDPSNEDECTLCDLCIERCPAGAIELIKNY